MLFDLDELSCTPKPTLPAIKVIPGQYPLVPEADQGAVTLIGPNLEHGPWIAGGAPLRWCRGESIGLHHDIDVWFKDLEQFSAAVLRLRDYGDVVCESPNAQTFRYYHPDSGTCTIQLIKVNFFASAQEVIDHFDFSVCQLVTDGKVMLYGKHTREDIESKRLRVVKVRADCAKRIVKYLSYGYKMALTDIKEHFALTENWKFTHEDYEATKL